MTTFKHPQDMSRGAFLPVLLFIMSVYPPLSTDMYLPALPQIAGEFHTSDTTMNLTLVLFFIFFAFSTLLWGPISDKYGRKKSAIAGIFCYLLASLACTATQTISVLIVARVIQAIGAGAPVTISIAIVQDVYDGERKKKILSALTALMMLAPVIAPLLGSLILTFAHWRVIFVVLTALGALSLAGCLRLVESNENMRRDESVLDAMLGVFRVASNARFSILLILFSLLALYALGFVGGSSLMYMQEFHTTPQMFSLFFGANALFAVLGAALYVPLSKRYSDNMLVPFALGIVALAGVFIVLLSQTSPLIFTLCLVPGTLASALLRPLSVEMLLHLGGAETGAVSALINFTFTIIGSIGMQIVALPWASRTQAFGVMTVIMAATCVAMWFFVGVEKNKLVQESSPDAA